MHESPAAATVTEWVLQGWRRRGGVGGTYRDEDAVCVFGLAALVCGHEVSQALDVVDAHHVDVIVEAESLDEREVDLEGDVTLVLLVGGEHAESHAVWVTVEGEHEESVVSACPPQTFLFFNGKHRLEHKLKKDEFQYSHIHDFGRLVNSDCQVVLLLCSDQQLLQRCACTLHP